MKKLAIKLSAFISMMTSGLMYAQQADSTQVGASGGIMPSIDLPTLLLVTAFLLFFVIWWLTRTFWMAVKYNKNKNLTDIGKTSILLLLGLFAGQELLAQGPPADPTKMMTQETFSMIVFTVIIVEVVIIYFLVKAIRSFTGLQEFMNQEAIANGTAEETLWDKMNQFKPLEEEGNIDTGHSYDGIRELDNITPPWFTAGFGLTILFALVYMWQYHVAKSAPLQIEEYENAVAEAKIAQEAFLKTQANAVDENNVVMMGASDIAAGAKLYSINCVTCHKEKGEGSVGPNLADDYWLHGGDIKDVFKSIKYGWTDKGMKSWKEDFSASQIAQITSFVMSLKGTNPPGGKEPQGELYKPADAAPAPADSAAATSAAPKDSAKATK